MFPAISHIDGVWGPPARLWSDAPNFAIMPLPDYFTGIERSRDVQWLRTGPSSIYENTSLTFQHKRFSWACSYDRLAWIGCLDSHELNWVHFSHAMADLHSSYTQVGIMSELLRCEPRLWLPAAIIVAGVCIEGSEGNIRHMICWRPLEWRSVQYITHQKVITNSKQKSSSAAQMTMLIVMRSP